jgi:lipopolysaccharide biosynthesis protein
LRDVQREQAKTARQYGIDAFCFHHHWFAGRRLLHKPIDDFLADPETKIDFCLCWANESWSRRWDGSESEILVQQTYSPVSDIAFMEGMVPFFRDRRYLRIRGAPVLVIYRPQQLPDPSATVERWREYCRRVGVGEIHLVAALTHGNNEYEKISFDAGVEFPPHNLDVSNRNPQIQPYKPFQVCRL